MPRRSASPPETASPDYIGLVSFLVRPFLESPESLSVDCESTHENQRVWIRLAFEGTDKGRVFGRGGRNIQAIRTVIGAAAATVGQAIYLDIYGSQSDSASSQDNGFKEEKPRTKRRRPPNSSKPSDRS